VRRHALSTQRPLRPRCPGAVGDRSAGRGLPAPRRSHARLVSGLVVLALWIGALPTVPPAGGAGPAARASLPDRPLRWLAAGDSYSAGEGLPVVDTREDLCQRAQNGAGGAAKAWAPAALDILLASDPRVAVGEFRFNACTGATTGEIDHAVDGRPVQWDGITRYDLVTFSFGGNDVGFASIITRCLGFSAEGAAAAARGAAAGARSGPGGTVPGAVASWRTRAGCPPEADMREAIDGLKGSYRALLRRVAEEVVTPGGNVVVVGYPNIVEEPQFWPNVTWFGLGTCQGIRREDALALRGAAGHLNATIGQAVADVDGERRSGVGFTFVDISTGQPDNDVPFDDPHLYEPSSGDRHALCAADQWLNGLIAHPRRERSFHPTAEGYAATADLVARRIRRVDWSHLLPDVANTTYPTGACQSRAPLAIAGGESPDAGEGALPDGSDNPQAYEVSGTTTTDLDNDGYQDVAALLHCTLGGATGFTDGWVWLSGVDGGSWRPIPRVVGVPDDDQWVWPARGFSVELRDEALVVSDYVVQGRSGDEAECCPGTAVEAVWRFDGDEFVQDGTPVVTAESDSPLNAFFVGTSLGFDTSHIATADAISQARDLDLVGSQITGATECGEGDITIFCTYPVQRQDGSRLTVQAVYGPPDGDYAGEGAYTGSGPAVVTSILPA
jgi:GDSL-like Lipase/Acylhydrolase family